MIKIMRVKKDYPNYKKITSLKRLGYKDELRDTWFTMMARHWCETTLGKVLSGCDADGANVKGLLHLVIDARSSHGLMVMKNVTDSSTLISIHKNVIPRNQPTGTKTS